MTAKSAKIRGLRLVSLLTILCTAVLAFASLPGTARADDVTFVMRNGHPYAIEVILFSQDRDHVWPGGDQVYILDSSDPVTIPLACYPAETICYGAWVSGDEQTYWGVGPYGEEECSDCCYTCEGGMTEEINLVP